MGARSSNQLQWLDLKIGHQYNSLSNDNQGDIPYCDVIIYAVSQTGWLDRISKL